MTNYEKSCVIHKPQGQNRPKMKFTLCTLPAHSLDPVAFDIKELGIQPIEKLQRRTDRQKRLWGKK